MQQRLALPEFWKLDFISLKSAAFTSSSIEIAYNADGGLKKLGSGSSGSAGAGAIGVDKADDEEDAQSTELARLTSENALLEQKVKNKEFQLKLEPSPN